MTSSRPTAGCQELAQAAARSDPSVATTLETWFVTLLKKSRARSGMG